MGHSKDVNSVAFSHDDSKLVSGSHDQSIKVWDAPSMLLHRAVLDKNAPSVALLIQQKADVNLQDKVSAISFSVYNSLPFHLLSARQLVYPTHVQGGNTPLHRVSSLDIAQLLLKSGANVHMLNKVRFKSICLLHKLPPRT
jgi:WD40 repeat protein